MTYKQKSFLIKLVYLAIDASIIYLSIYAACLIRAQTLSFTVTPSSVFLDPANPFRFLFAFWLFAVIIFNNSYGLYQTQREIGESIELWNVFKSVLVASLTCVVALYALKIEGFPRTVFAVSTTWMITLLSIWRILKRMFVQYLVVHGYNNFNAVIIGAGKVGKALAKEIESKPELGIQMVGFLDDFKESVPEEKIKILGKINDFPWVVRREFISKVFITIHHDSQVFLKLLEQARELGVAVRVIPQGFELISCEFSKYNIGFIPILEYSNSQSPSRQFGKRLFDFITSLTAMIVLAPVFLMIAILIKIDSRGPVFYVSERYGRRGRIFRMFKFRSMVTEAEHILSKIKDKNEKDGPIFKIKDDPRVTRIGRFLRRYSLDELPQFINVLKGDMSVVGPRPLPIEQIEKEDLRQLRRLEVRPGITGLWQIRGRSDISFSRLLKWDIWYINNWSFWLDLNIILQTVPVVLRCRGAY